jgi:magnesium/cobalt transport protein CorA
MAAAPSAVSTPAMPSDALAAAQPISDQSLFAYDALEQSAFEDPMTIEGLPPDFDRYVQDHHLQAPLACFETRQGMPRLEEFANALVVSLYTLQNRSELKKATSYNTAGTGAAAGGLGGGLHWSEIRLLITPQWVISTGDHYPEKSLSYMQAQLDRGSFNVNAGPVSFAAELMDALIEEYSPFLETLDAELLKLETRMIAGRHGLEKSVFKLQRNILALRRFSWKQQELFYALSHRDIALITHKDKQAFTQLSNHMSRIANRSDSARDILSGMLSIHLSLASNRMNDVMRILTMFTAVLMPLTLIAGVYGMNFRFMPELNAPQAYPIVLAVMGLLTVVMLVYFRYKRWL